MQILDYPEYRVKGYGHHGRLIISTKIAAPSQEAAIRAAQHTYRELSGIDQDLWGAIQLNAIVRVAVHA